MEKLHYSYLDEILKYVDLHFNGISLISSIVEHCFDTFKISMDNCMVDTLLEKLKDDKYLVDSIDVLIPDTKKYEPTVKITFEGQLFIKNGGYLEKQRKKDIWFIKNDYKNTYWLISVTIAILGIIIGIILWKLKLQ
ncbi:MAG: hypothetical protein HGB12_18100 [Bacteroidetes bacterium]|nr:hypothetical protein [Bacteroidota bacterium]